ncbi:MAG TPA: diphthamide biosynthesis enzyme Dph2 [Desulfurococcales archaeon]|nr:diphthamide biosynthesis enzyme Dph2 [Desulfurococcales archaeon]
MVNTCENVPYDFELERVISELKKLKAKRVLIQLPNGLKKYARVICSKLASLGLDVYLSASHTYGGCDVAENEAKLVKADVVIHFGHTKYYEPKINTIFIPSYSKVKLNSNTLSKLTSYLKKHNFEVVSLSAVIQHIPLLRSVKEHLENNGIKCIITPIGGYCRIPGQILGCSYEGAIKINKEVNAHIVIAGGLFHGLGLGLATGKTTIILDPYEQTFKDITEYIQKTLKMRYWKIFEAKNRQNYVLIIGSKPGQYRPSLVNLLADRLLKRGKNVYRIIANELSVDILRNIDCKEYDVYVITSCPRLPIDDLYSFEKPVLTPGEALMIADDAYDKYIFPW